MSIIHSARALVLTCTLLAAPGLVAASLPVARAAQNTPPSAGRNVSALPTPARAPEPAAAAPTISRGPVIGVTETTQDGGTVEEGTLLHFQFKITNQGAADLEIKEVKPSCGCTVPHWDKLIQPGKSGVIEAEVHTEHFRGPIGKHLTVISNDAAHPELELSLTGKITPLVQVSPSTVALVTVDDRPVTQEFTLERAGGLPMKILQVSAAPPYVKTELTPLPGSGRYRLALTATMDTPLGRTTIPVTVRTDLQKCEYLPLTLMLDRGIVTTPSMVFLGPLAPNPATPTQRALSVARQKPPFRVTAVTVDDPRLQAKLQTVQEGQQYQIVLSYSGGWEPGVVERMLTLTTDDRDQREIKIPIQAMVQQGTPARAGGAGAAAVVGQPRVDARSAAPTAWARPASAGATETQATAGAAAHGPVMVVAETSQDGGTVEEGTTVHYRFTVANRGRADLAISDVKPSCGCTVPHWEKLIPPEKSGTIEAEVYTAHFRGGFTKHLTVVSNDPQHPDLNLTLIGQATPLVQVDPGTVGLLAVEDRPVTQEFTLERSGGQPMKILEVTPAEPFLKTEVSPLVGIGRYKVAVTATMDTPLGQKSVVVTVRTDIVQSDSVTLVMVVTRGIVATPPVLFLGSVEREPKAPAQTTLTLARRTVPFHITGVAVDDPKLRSTLRTVQDGQQYQISVSYAGGWAGARSAGPVPGGLVRKTLTVTTDDPRQREIEVPVQVIVGPPTPPLAAAAAR